MDRKYDEVMDKIEVTPEMRQRILSSIQNMDYPRKTSQGNSLPSVAEIYGCGRLHGSGAGGSFEVFFLFER